MSSTSMCNSLIERLLNQAVKAGCYEKVCQLLSQSVNINRMCRGQLPLHVASKGTRDDQLSGNFLRVVKMLVDLGADVNRVDEDKWMTPLMYACENGQSAISNFLLSRGAEVNAGQMSGNTPLLYALNSKPLKVSLISDLLKAGGIIECNDSKGSLLHAILTIPGHFPENYLKVVKLLVEAGADVNHVDQKGMMTSLMCACENGQSAIGSYLLKMGAKVNVRDFYGNTPLLYALYSKHLNISFIFDLLKSGASVKCSDNKGSPLHAIIKRGKNFQGVKWDILELLLSHPCDIDAKDQSQGATPLTMAFFNDDLQSAKLLVRAGCKVNIESSIGYTPLSYAVCERQYHFVELLLAAGGRILRHDRENMIRYLESEDPSMLQRLLAVGAECPMLTIMCRRTFFDHYGTEAQCWIKKLPLPPLIKRYLSFEIL